MKTHIIYITVIVMLIFIGSAIISSLVYIANEKNSGTIAISDSGGKTYFLNKSELIKDIKYSDFIDLTKIKEER